MPSIYLLRHCDYANPRNILPGRLPVELSPKGLENAGRLAQYFQDKNISHIYSSAVRRCQQTSQIVSNGEIPITFDKRLLQALSGYQGYWGENRHEGGYHFFSHTRELGGEDFANIRERMASFWDEVALNAQDNIIICSHGDPLQLMFSHLKNEPTVNEMETEDQIPGWLEKGEFFEIILENKQVREVKPAQSV